MDRAFDQIAKTLLAGFERCFCLFALDHLLAQGRRAAFRLAVEAGLFDGNGGVAGKRLQQRFFLVIEDVSLLPVNVEHTDEPAAVTQRRPEIAHDPERDRTYLVIGVEPIVRTHIRHGERATLAGHQPGQTLSHLERGFVHDLLGEAVAPGHHQIIAVEQPEAGALDAEQLRRLLGDGAESLFDLDPTGHLGTRANQPLETPRPLSQCPLDPSARDDLQHQVGAESNEKQNDCEGSNDKRGILLGKAGWPVQHEAIRW